jgi:hypothetical protein
MIYYFITLLLKKNMRYLKFLFIVLVLFTSCGEKNNGKQEQTISFGNLLPHNLSEGAFELTATASSGLPVSFASSNSSIASINGNTVTLRAKGTVEITASQPGNDEYFEAPNIVRSLIINEDNNPDKSDQTITFTLSVSEWTYGSGDLILEATASSGLPVVFSSDYPYVSITGNVLRLTYEGVHYDANATITASQPGNDEYNAAPNVSRTLHVQHND